jgi:hypothetical protein
VKRNGLDEPHRQMKKRSPSKWTELVHWWLLVHSGRGMPLCYFVYSLHLPVKYCLLQGGVALFCSGFHPKTQNLKREDPYEENL